MYDTDWAEAASTLPGAVCVGRPKFVLLVHGRVGICSQVMADPDCGCPKPRSRRLRGPGTGAESTVVGSVPRLVGLVRPGRDRQTRLAESVLGVRWSGTTCGRRKRSYLWGGIIPRRRRLCRPKGLASSGQWPGGPWTPDSGCRVKPKGLD